MKKFIFCLLTAGSIFSLYAGEFNLVRNGKAESFLETNPHPSPHEKLAVKELSTYINRISGASISTGAEKSKNRIVLADLEKNRTTLPAAVVSKLEKASSREAYHIYRDGNTIYIAGRTPAGTLYGTYAFIEDFLGVRFFHAEAEYVPSVKNITISKADLFRQPWAEQRLLNEWKGSVAPFSIDDFHIWMTRRGFSWRENYPSRKLQDYAPCGGKRAQGGRHLTFEKSIPKKLFKTNPEFFPLQDGKRVCKERSQRCLSNPAVQEMLLKYVLHCIEKGMTFSFGYHDSTDGFCYCQNCKAMGTDEKGQYTISNYAHTFCRIMMEKVLKKAPGAELYYDIYSVFRDMPTLKNFQYPAGIKGEFCPHGRCYAHPLENSECNAPYDELMKKWGKISALGVYDYYAYGQTIYCPTEYVMAQDMKLYVKRKIRYFIDDCSNRALPYPHANWQFYYVMSKIFWDVGTDVEKLMDDAYTFYYEKAANPMKEYHAYRRQLWDAASGHAMYGYGKIKRYAHCLTVPGMEKRLLSLLDKAEKLAGNDKEILKRINDDRKFLTKYWITEAEKIRQSGKDRKAVQANRLEGKIIIDGKLDENAWKRAAIVSGFLNIATKAPAAEETRARVLFDDQNFYISFEAMTEHAWSSLKAKEIKKDSPVWQDDCLEIFLMPPGEKSRYYHFVVNSLGTLYDAREKDPSFESGATVKTSRKKDRYIVEMQIPVSAMNRQKITCGEPWKIHFTREVRNLQPPAERESSGLNAADSHEYMYFTPVIPGTEVVRNGNFTELVKVEEKQKSSRKLTSDKLPKFWSVHNGGLCKDDSGKNVLETNSGVIYTFLPLPQQGKSTRISGYVTVTVKGKAEIYFTGCIRNRRKGDKRPFGNEIKHPVKTLKKTDGKTVVNIDFEAEPYSQYYLEIKSQGKTVLHNAVLAR